MIQETVDDEETSDSYSQYSSGKFNFLEVLIKDILFDERYLVSLKEKISKLKNSQIHQRELKKLIIEHDLQAVEDLRGLIKLNSDAEIKKNEKNLTAQEKKLEKYKQLFTKIAIRVEKIYRKLKYPYKLELDRITSQKVLDSLISAENIFENYKSSNDLPDGSPIINNYAKALEIMLDECVSVHFIPLIRKKYYRKQMSPDIYKKFGWLRENK